MSELPELPVTIALYAGMLILAVGASLTFGLADARWKQRAAYVVAAGGFLMAWGGGHISTVVRGGELFSPLNVLGFLVLTTVMCLTFRHAALAGKEAEGGGESGWLRRFGFVEGASLILLMFVAMPLKYLADFDLAVRYVGMAHGGLFMVFVGWALFAAREVKWTLEKTLGALVASVIPFGPFVADLGE